MKVHIEAYLTRSHKSMFFIYILLRIFGQKFQSSTHQNEIGIILWDRVSIMLGLTINNVS